MKTKLFRGLVFAAALLVAGPAFAASRRPSESRGHAVAAVHRGGGGRSVAVSHASRGASRSIARSGRSIRATRSVATRGRSTSGAARGLTASRSFAAAGNISSQTTSLSDYAASFYQDVSDQSNAVTQSQTTQDDRLQQAQSQQSSESGVNLDEELTNLTTYQQAYSASARLLSVVDQLYQTLLQIQ